MNEDFARLKQAMVNWEEFHTRADMEHLRKMKTYCIMTYGFEKTIAVLNKQTMAIALAKLMEAVDGELSTKPKERNIPPRVLPKTRKKSGNSRTSNLARRRKRQRRSQRNYPTSRKAYCLKA